MSRKQRVLMGCFLAGLPLLGCSDDSPRYPDARPAALDGGADLRRVVTDSLPPAFDSDGRRDAGVIPDAAAEAREAASNAPDATLDDAPGGDSNIPSVDTRLPPSGPDAMPDLTTSPDVRIPERIDSAIDGAGDLTVIASPDASVVIDVSRSSEDLPVEVGLEVGRDLGSDVGPDLGPDTVDTTPDVSIVPDDPPPGPIEYKDAAVDHRDAPVQPEDTMVEYLDAAGEVLCSSVTCNTCVFYVDKSVATAGDGSSAAQAMHSVQSAINAAAIAAGQCCTCDVRVAAATYYIYNSDVSDTVQLKKNVNLYGGYPVGFSGARDVVANVTTLDGHASADPGAVQVQHVVTGADGCTIDGFTIQGGAATSGDTEADLTGLGGGMLNYGVSPAVVDCTFVSNSALYGGAVYNYQNVSTFSGCTFKSNTATHEGGAVLDRESSVIFSTSTFDGNSADHGGAMYETATGSVTLSKPSFKNNTAATAGGALFIAGPRTAVVTAGRFSGNAASAATGGAIHNEASGTLVLSDSLLWKNTAATYGGALYDAASSTVLSSTLYGNTAATAGDAIYSKDVNTVVTNAIVWTTHTGSPTSGPLAKSGGAAPVVSYSDVQSGCTVSAACTSDETGNLAADPVFVAPADGDFRLWLTSSLIDRGSNAAVPMELTLDVAGASRVFDGDGNATATVDMGAYELNLTTSTLPPVYVDPAATGAGTGASWADAYTDLGAALDHTDPFTALWIRGSADDDTFDFSTHAFFFSNTIHLDGLAGNDTLKLGAIVGSDALDHVTSVETLTFADATSTSITAIDDLVAAGATLTVDLSAVTGAFTWHGSGEADGAYRFTAGAGTLTLTGGAGDDMFDFTGAGATLSSAQHLVGGAGSDTLHTATLDGASCLDHVSGIESIRFGGSADISVTTVDGLVASGKTLAVDASATTGTFTWNGAAETDGAFSIIPGSGTQTLTGGAGADVFDFTALTMSVSHTVDGGAGNDTLNLGAVSGTTALNKVTNVDTIELHTDDAISVTPASTLSPSGHVVTVDASAITTHSVVFNGSSSAGGFILTAASNTTGNTLTGGQAADQVTVSGTGTYTINSYTGDDTITVSGDGTFTVNGGAGADEIHFGTRATSSALYLSNLTSGTDTVYGFVGTGSSHDVAYVSTASGLYFVSSGGGNVTAGASAVALLHASTGPFTYSGGVNMIMLVDTTYADSATVVTALETGGNNQLTFGSSVGANAELLVVYSDGTDAHLIGINANNWGMVPAGTSSSAMTYTELAIFKAVGLADLATWSAADFHY